MATAIIENPLRKGMRLERTAEPCVIVIFGASGDLTKRKLMPGLYNLACEGCMNPRFEVLGIGRTPMNSEEFRKKTGEAAAKSKDTRDFSESGWEDFEQRLHYMVGDINDPNSIRSYALGWTKWKKMVRARTICSMCRRPRP